MNGFVDGRCACVRCERRTQEVYRMVGRCKNCRADGILVLYRAGDTSGAVDCPHCGYYRGVSTSRLATADEIPVEAESRP